MAPGDEALTDALERLEWRDDKRGGVAKTAQITRRTALTGGAAGLAAMLIDACGSAGANATPTARHTTSTTSNAGPIASIFGVQGGYRFTFVNHATVSPFFIPTVNGISDACALLNCAYDWVGSRSNDPAGMARAIHAAVADHVDGIATTLPSHALSAPVAAAARAGIPVLSYNSDLPGIERLAYIGSDLLKSGHEAGHYIRRLLPRGGPIMVFIATPGSANLQPRLAGIEQAVRNTNVTVSSQASGISGKQALTTVDQIVSQQLDAYRGYFGVDAGSTTAVAQAIAQNGLKGKVVGGGFDLSEQTVQLLADDTIQFAIDQQPYLQGFLPVLELFLYRASERLTGIADVDTGLRLLTPKTIIPYADTQSRYEGTSTGTGVQGQVKQPQRTPKHHH